MRFLINPECYHKMCESCVDRIFSSGPASCPVAGCHKTLRKNRFRKQTFEDIGVEREVDIRRRVMQILNRREEEFTTKRAYDDFLEQREEIISNITLGIDVAKTEEALRKYAAENTVSIRANQALEAQEANSIREQQTLEQEQARLRRLAARQEYEDEQRELLREREDVLARLAAGRPRDAEAIAKEGQRNVLLKKSSARRSEEERIRLKQAALRNSEAAAKRGVSAAAVAAAADPAAATGGSSLIKGLKQVKMPEPEKPYDPFGGLVPDKRDYYTMRDFYPSSYLDPIRQDVRMQAGGYDLKEYYSRTLLEAFAGLGCFIDEEVSQRDATAALGTSQPAVAEGPAMAAVSSSEINEATV